MTTVMQLWAWAIGLSTGLVTLAGYLVRYGRKQEALEQKVDDKVELIDCLKTHADLKSEVAKGVKDELAGQTHELRQINQRLSRIEGRMDVYNGRQ